MKKEYVNFINLLHGYLIRIKEIHWNTNNNSEHLLCDEIQDCLMGCEDRFAECAMGMDGKHFQVGQLKPLLPNATSLKSMLDELHGDIIDMKRKNNGENGGGLNNVLDEMLENCNKFKYRATQS